MQCVSRHISAVFRICIAFAHKTTVLGVHFGEQWIVEIDYVQEFEIVRSLARNLIERIERPKAINAYFVLFVSLIFRLVIQRADVKYVYAKICVTIGRTERYEEIFCFAQVDSFLAIEQKRILFSKLELSKTKYCKQKFFFFIEMLYKPYFVFI